MHSMPISKESQRDNRLVSANCNKCVDLTDGNQGDGTSVSTCCFPPGINSLKALTLFRLKFGTATAVSTKSGMLATPLITSLKPPKRSNTVQTTVDPVRILGRIVKLSGSSTCTFQICIRPRLIRLCSSADDFCLWAPRLFLFYTCKSVSKLINICSILWSHR